MVQVTERKDISTYITEITEYLSACNKRSVDYRKSCLCDFVPVSFCLNVIMEQNPSLEETKRIFPSGDLQIKSH